MAVAGIPRTEGSEPVARAHGHVGDMAMMHGPGPGWKTYAADFLVARVEQTNSDGIRVRRVHRSIDPVAGHGHAHGFRQSSFASLPDRSQERSAKTDLYSER